MSIFPKFTYRFSTVLIKVTGCFGENDKLILKCMMAKIEEQKAYLYILHICAYICIPEDV